jgi:monofunctional biosynthetic peptidoglycan transglycosylase
MAASPIPPPMFFPTAPGKRLLVFTDIRFSISRFLGILRRILLVFLLATLIPVALLRWIPPPASLFMLIAKASAMIEGDRDFELYYRWVSWEEIAPPVKLAVVAAEDQLFARHLGFDLNAIQQAFEYNQKGKRIRGASTISQQTAKNLFLYSGRSYLRKALEAYFTALIELLWPKQRILEIYLNVAQFGKGIYGVSEASRLFFGKSASRLSGREAALLAAVLPNPVLLRADRPSAYVERRRQWILRQMKQLGGTEYLEEL